MTMQAKLYALFLADKQLRGLRARLDAARRRHTAQQTRLQQFQQQQQELVAQHRAAQASAQGLERETTAIEQKITRLREQMNTVRNNKEYSALLVEVNTLKIDKGKIEEQALERMEQVDRLKAEMQAIAARVADQSKLTTVAADEVAAAESELGAELAELQTKRDAAAELLPPDLRGLYERAAAIHEEEAMAEVVEENRRHMEFSCGGCYMAIPVELLNTLLSHSDKPVLCPSCGRILYLADALRESYADKSAAGSR
jgi:uncharacterized protein